MDSRVLVTSQRPRAKNFSKTARFSLSGLAWSQKLLRGVPPQEGVSPPKPPKGLSKADFLVLPSKW